VVRDHFNWVPKMGQENLNFEDGARYLRIPPFGDRRLINGQQGGGKEWLSNTYFLEDDVGGEPATKSRHWVHFPG